MPNGMPLRDKEIMEKLFDLKKLNSSEIAFVLGCSVQVVQKRKREYETKGTITAVKEMSWQKIKPEHREVLLKYVEEHGENKSLREMSEYLAEATGVKVTTVTISRMLKAAAEANEGQGRRKIRAPRTEDPSARVAWIAPEAQRATPVLRGDRVAWTLNEQSPSPAVQPPLAAQQGAASPIQPQQVAQHAVQMLGQADGSTTPASTEASPTPMEGLAEQESAGEAGEV